MNDQQKEMVKAKPERIPPPTYMPFLLAVSLLFVGWGMISHWILCIAGGTGICFSLAGWIKELLYE